MIVQHNIASMNANRQLGISTGKVKTSTEKLSSGYRINRAADDAAGLAISEKMRGQIRGLTQASSNAEDGISLIQTAEGALQETQNIIQRMRELAVQAASDTNTNDDREQIQQEITQLTNEVDRIANTSEFNTKKLLDGSLEGSKSFRPGVGSAEGTFINGEVKVVEKDVSSNAIIAIDDVIRIEFTKDGVQAENLGEGYNIASLRGHEVSYEASTGTITIANGQYAGDLSALRITNSNTATMEDYVIQISGFSNIKAGDTITINMQKATLTRPQTTGKEALRVQVGANGGQEAFLGIASMKAKDLGITQTTAIRTLTNSVDNEIAKANAGNVGAALTVTSQSMASIAIEAYDNALRKVSDERANLGALQNRLEHSINNLDTSAENLQDAESRIRDVDMAEEMTEYSKYNILMQAGQSMLAQANQMTQGVLNLLQ
ncbi:MAG: flagellin [Lachnospiraceae bacterium]|nr:flagellin [Lachnospiraceae bacterium]